MCQERWRASEMQIVPKRGAAHVVRDPRICGGDPTVAGTRIPVHSIVVQWRLYHDVDRLIEAFPRLDAAAIRVALEYYEEHRQEIDGLIEEHEQAAYSAD
jgi:uncharacterized protein (DUF433 family)